MTKMYSCAKRAYAYRRIIDSQSTDVVDSSITSIPPVLKRSLKLSMLHPSRGLGDGR